MIEIESFRELKKILGEFNKYSTIVIIAKYNYGKSSFCTDALFEFFGRDKTIYVTFTDQSKPNFSPRKNQLEYGQSTENKIIIFDEISDDKGRNVESFLANLIPKNKVIILTNPYGSSDEPAKEEPLLIKNMNFVLPKKTLIIWVKKGMLLLENARLNSKKDT